MEKTLGVLLLLISITTVSFANESKYLLTEVEQATDPAFVLEKLKEGVRSPVEIDKPVNMNRDYGAAVKYYGLLLQLYPEPVTIIKYADSKLLMLQEIRTRNNDITRFRSSDLAAVLPYYKSALDVNNKVDMLSVSEGQKLIDKINCIESFTKDSNKTEFNCNLQ